LRRAIIVSRARATLLITVALLVLPASLVAARGETLASGAGRTEVHRLDPAAASSYWTAQRMRRAIPLPGPEVSAREHAATRAPEATGSGLEPGSVPPTVPAGTVALDATLEVSQPTHSPVTLAYPFTSGAVPTSDYRSYPYSTIGRIFFTDPTSGLNYACSGTALTSQNQSVVWTAGHCVHGGGPGEAYYTNWVFVPSYVDHSRPVGTWPALVTLTTPQWVASANLSYDMAAAVVAPLGGKRLTEVTGGRGIEWNQAQQQTFEPFGYPAAAPFNGERIYYCESDLATTGNPSGSGPATLGIGCDMTQGSSGGGWIVDGSFVNSNVSYGIEGEPNVFYGPYFGDSAATLYQAASTSTLPGPLPTETTPPVGGDPTPSPSPSSSTPDPEGTATPPPPGDTTAPALSDVADRPDPFSPNGDGFKDKVKFLFTLSEPAKVTMTIFKPNGSLLGYLLSNADAPQAARYKAKWNGKAGSKVVKNGTYKYVIQAKDAAGNQGAAQGTVTVRR
jgi:V8-like Glu-specific endopeptidase